MQRITRGALAREFKRRALRSKALLRKAINEASVVADLDAALVEHTENMRMMLCIFSIPFPELAEVKTLRAAMQLWLDLELEITKLLAEHAKGGDAADAVADAIEVCMYIACMHANIIVCARACARGGRATAPHPARVQVAVLRAEKIKDVRCNKAQWALYEAARKVRLPSRSPSRSPDAQPGAPTLCRVARAAATPRAESACAAAHLTDPSRPGPAQSCRCSTPTWAGCCFRRPRRRCGSSTSPRCRRRSRRRAASPSPRPTSRRSPSSSRCRRTSAPRARAARRSPGPAPTPNTNPQP